MQLLASCTLEQAMGFNGKLVIPNEDEKKPDKVFLNVEYSDSDGSVEDFFTKVSSLGKNVRCVSFPVGVVSSVPEEWKNRVFIKNTIDEVMQGLNHTEIPGVVDLVHLDSDYPCKKYKLTLRDLVSICEEHPSVRFYGGNLLAVEGLRIGRFEEGKDKSSPVFKDIYDTFVEVNLNDLDGLKEIVSKTRKKAESSEDSKGKKARVRSKQPKERKSSKRAEAAMKLFGGMEEEF